MRRGFTMVEAIVVIGIIGLLLGITIPAIQRVRGLADRTACLNNLRQIGTGLHLYHSDYKRLPPQPADFNNDMLSKDPNVLLGWMGLILPYIDQGPLWTQSVRACQLDSKTFHNPPHVGYSTVIKLYICPSDDRITAPLTPPGSKILTAYSSYLGNEGTVYQPGVLGSDLPGIRLTQIRDGMSNTLMVGERPPPDSLQAGQWYSQWILERFGGPNHTIVTGQGIQFVDDLECATVESIFGPGRTDNPCDRFHYWSLHPGGANFLFADGSSRYLPYSAKNIIFPLASRMGGEIVEIPD